METRRNKQIFCFPTFLWVDVYFQLKTTERESEEKTESWMRGQQTCSLTIHFNMWTVSSDVSIQRRHWQPLSVHLWAYCTHPTHDVNDVMSEGWPQHWGLRPLHFSNSGVDSFTSHKNQTSVSAVRRDLRFFVLIGKVKRSEEFSFTWEKSSPSEGYFSVALQNMATVSLFSYMNMHDDRGEIIRLKTILCNSIWFWI